MSLQTQNIDLQFTSGADTKTDSNNVLFSSFQELKESRIDRIGAVVPRGGFVAGANIYPVSTFPSYALASNGTYTVIGTGSTVRLQTPTTSNNMGYNARGGFLRLPSGHAIPFSSSVASGGGTVCHVWASPSLKTIGVLVLSTTNNEIILRTELAIPQQFYSKLYVVYSNNAYVIFFANSIYTIQGYTFPITNFSASSVVPWTISSGANFPTNTPITAGSFVTGQQYVITTVGTTNFTLIGASANTVGVSFVATGAGTGTGTATQSNSGLNFDILAIGNTIYFLYSRGASTKVVTLLRVVDNGPGNRVGTSVIALQMSGPAVCHNLAPATSFTDGAVAVFAGDTNGNMKGAVATNGMYMVSPSTTYTGPTGTLFLRSFSVEQTAAQGGPKIVCKFNYSLNDFVVRHATLVIFPDLSTGDFETDPRGSIMITGGVVVDNAIYSVYDAHTSATYGSQCLVQHDISTLYLTPLYAVGRFGSGKNLGQYWAEINVGAVPRPILVNNKIYFPLDAVTGIDSLSAAPVTSAIVNEAVSVSPYITATILQWDLVEILPTYIAVANNEALYLGSAPRDVGAFEGPGVPWPECSTNWNDATIVSGTTGVGGVGRVSYVFAKLYTSPSGVEYRTYSTIYVANFTVANQTVQFPIPVDNLIANPATVPGTSLYSSGAGLELYRTERNGTIFYRCASNIAPASITNGVGTYTDNMLQADLLNQRLADINGAELYPESMPAIRAIAPFKSRLAYVDCDDPNTVKFDRGTPAPAGTTATSGISVEAPTEGGPIVAIQQMDGALYIFKANSIWSVYGDVPTSTGEGGTLSTPSLVFNGVGCNSSKGVVLTSKGILFKGAKGIYLLMRNQEITFMGQGPYDDRSISIVGSGIGETQAEVYFVHSDGKIWVLNTDLNAWYEWTYSSPIKAAIVSNKVLTVLSDTQIASISLAATTDQPLSPAPATPIVQDFTTGWLRLDGIQGFQRVKKINFLIDALANTTLTIDLYKDYENAAPTQTITINTSDLAIGATGNREFELHVKSQKSSALKFRVRTSGYGVKFSGATITVASKGGLAKNTSNTY